MYVWLVANAHRIRPLRSCARDKLARAKGPTGSHTYIWHTAGDPVYICVSHTCVIYNTAHLFPPVHVTDWQAHRDAHRDSSFFLSHMNFCSFTHEYGTHMDETASCVCDELPRTRLELFRTHKYCTLLDETAMHCNPQQALQTAVGPYSPTHCDTLWTQCKHTVNTMQQTATHCNTLQHTANCSRPLFFYILQHPVNTLQTRCSKLQYTAKCSRPLSSYTLQHTVTHCNTL